MTSRIDTIKNLINQAKGATDEEVLGASLDHALHEVDNLVADMENIRCIIRQGDNDLADLYSIQPTKEDTPPMK